MGGVIYKDYPTFFGLSLGNYHALSFTGSLGNQWSGYSVSGSFVPNRNLNPVATSANEVMQALCTLVMDLMSPGIDARPGNFFPRYSYGAQPVSL